MTISRRKFLRILGSSTAIGAAGLTVTACDSMPSSAIAPWAGPDATETDPRIFALSHALLAPSPHNMQPWMVDLSQPNEIGLYVDQTRLLPETDPQYRQIMIGQGTFLELLDIAAGSRGFDTEISTFPDGPFALHTARRAARVRMISNPERNTDALFTHIFARRSTKEPFDTDRPLEARHAQAFGALHMPPGSALTVTDDPGLVQHLRDLTWQAMETEIRTPRTFRESIDRMRLGASEIADNPDGIDISGPMIWWGKLLGFVSKEALSDPTSSSFQIGLDQQRELSETAMAFAWLTTEGNGREAQIMAGRAYARLNLTATEHGIALHPMSQLLQEYPEMAGHQRAFLEAAGAKPGETIQMLVRLGYAAAPGPAPRRPLRDLLMS